MALVRHRINRLAHGKDPRPGTRPLPALIGDRRRRATKLSRYRAWLPQHRNVTAPQADAPSR